MENAGNGKLVVDVGDIQTRAAGLLSMEKKLIEEMLTAIVSAAGEIKRLNGIIDAKKTTEGAQ